MRIKEIQLETHRLPALKKFYPQTLELPVVEENADSFTVRAGFSHIKFSRAESSQKPFYHFAFNIPENQIHQARKWLSSRVELIKSNGEDIFRFDSWNAEAVYFYDPAGNIVEFIARHNLNNRSDEPFSGNSLLCVSEIGVPVENVRLFSGHIKQELNLQLWDGDEESFAAVGDEEGLFIIVPVGRPWFAANKKAEDFSAAVDVDKP